MYNNIGKKIKMLAKFIGYFLTGTCIFVGFILTLVGSSNGGMDRYLIPIGVIVMVAGLALWVLSLFLYGFGILVNNSETVANWTRRNTITRHKEISISQNNSRENICPNCGNKLDENALFCGSCGEQCRN